MTLPPEPQKYHIGHYGPTNGWVLADDYDALRSAADELESRAAALQKQRDEEIDEFNAGYEAYKNGVRLDDLPSTPHDQMGIGWAWAAIGPLQKELEAVRKLLRDAQQPLKAWAFTLAMSDDIRRQVMARTVLEIDRIDAALSKESPGE